MSDSTLRDELAAAALIGLLTNMEYLDPKDRVGPMTQGERMAQWAYEYADKMLAARAGLPDVDSLKQRIFMLENVLRVADQRMYDENAADQDWVDLFETVFPASEDP